MRHVRPYDFIDSLAGPHRAPPDPEPWWPPDPEWPTDGPWHWIPSWAVVWTPVMQFCGEPAAAAVRCAAPCPWAAPKRPVSRKKAERASAKAVACFSACRGWFEELAETDDDPIEPIVASPGCMGEHASCYVSASPVVAAAKRRKLEKRAVLSRAPDGSGPGGTGEHDWLRCVFLMILML